MASRHNKLRRAAEISRKAGIRGLALHSIGFARHKLGIPAPPPPPRRVPEPERARVIPLPLGFVDGVDIKDAMAADPNIPRDWVTPGTPGPYELLWIIPPAGPGSGGHHNLFRFVNALDAAGHRCRISIYDPRREATLRQHRRLIRRNFEALPSEIELWHPESPSGDALIATSWHTAYPAFTHASSVPRFYFVQDFEPSFYPAGSLSVLAENTYRFGFHGLTAGTWLKQLLEADYGMQCDAFEFGVDAQRYSLTNTAPRRKVLFYGRPGTPRRAWELGILALNVFHRAHPEIEIHTAGADLHESETGVPMMHHGVVSLDDLNALYNDMSAALILSLTNCSLLPKELLAAGCIPVINDAPNNRLLLDNPFVTWTQPTPHAIAEALLASLATATPELRRLASESVRSDTWSGPELIVEQAIRARLRG